MSASRTMSITLMIRAAIVLGLLASVAHAEEIPGYSAQAMPCRVVADGFDEKTNTAYMHTVVLCEHGELDKKSLRELSILRNTIYARLGWDGYRKPWLRDHFHAQPWF